MLTLALIEVRCGSQHGGERIVETRLTATHLSFLSMAILPRLLLNYLSRPLTTFRTSIVVLGLRESPAVVYRTDDQC